MAEVVNGKIIDTIKGKQGTRAVYYPVGPDGKPLIPREHNEIYDERGKKKSPPIEGAVVDTEA